MFRSTPSCYSALVGLSMVLLSLGGSFSCVVPGGPVTVGRHDHIVTSIAFSPCEAEITSASLNGVIALWDVTRQVPGRMLLVERSGIGPLFRCETAHVLGLACTSKSQLLAAVQGTVGDRTGAEIQSWTVKGELTDRVWWPGMVEAVGTDPQGRALVVVLLPEVASSHRNHWGIICGPMTKCFEVGQSDRLGLICSAAVSSALASIAVGWTSGTVQVLSVHAGPTWHVRDAHRGSVSAVVFSRDGTLLASGGSDDVIGIWDVRTAQCVRRISARSNGVQCLSFHPGADLLAAGGNDGTIRLWNIGTGECRTVLEAHDGGVYAIAFNDDGRLLVSGGQDGRVRLWDLAWLGKMEQGDFPGPQSSRQET